MNPARAAARASLAILASALAACGAPVPAVPADAVHAVFQPAPRPTAAALRGGRVSAYDTVTGGPANVPMQPLPANLDSSYNPTGVFLVKRK